MPEYLKMSGRMRDGNEQEQNEEGLRMRSCGFPKASEKSGGGYSCNPCHRVRKIQVDQMA